MKAKAASGLQCPFSCGREPFLASYEPFDRAGIEHFVRCPGCGYIGPVGKTPDEARELHEATAGGTAANDGDRATPDQAVA